MKHRIGLCRIGFGGIAVTFDLREMSHTLSSGCRRVQLAMTARIYRTAGVGAVKARRASCLQKATAMDLDNIELRNGKSRSYEKVLR